MRIVRSAGVFLLNVLIAVGAELLVAYPIPRKLTLQWSLWTNITVYSGLSAAGAFVLGYATLWRLEEGRNEVDLVGWRGLVWSRSPARLSRAGQRIRCR